MNDHDVYEGPLDMATFGRPVRGPLSDDKRWLVNPLIYDPTRPLPLKNEEQQGETHMVSQRSLRTPSSDPVPLGDYAAAATATSTSDVDLGLLAGLGQAVSRGAAELPSRQWISGDKHHDEHTAQPVPSTAPQTPETAMVSSFTSPHVAAIQVGLYQQPHQPLQQGEIHDNRTSFLFIEPLKQEEKWP